MLVSCKVIDLLVSQCCLRIDRCLLLLIVYLIIIENQMTEIDLTYTGGNVSFMFIKGGKLPVPVPVTSCTYTGNWNVPCDRGFYMYCLPETLIFQSSEVKVTHQWQRPWSILLCRLQWQVLIKIFQNVEILKAFICLASKEIHGNCPTQWFTCLSLCLNTSCVGHKFYYLL